MILLNLPYANSSLQVGDLILITAYNVTNAMMSDPNFSIPSEDFIPIGNASQIITEDGIFPGIIVIENEITNVLPGGVPIPIKPAVAFVKQSNTIGAKGYYLETYFQQPIDHGANKHYLYSVNTRATESSK